MASTQIHVFQHPKLCQQYVYSQVFFKADCLCQCISFWDLYALIIQFFIPHQHCIGHLSIETGGKKFQVSYLVSDLGNSCVRSNSGSQVSQWGGGRLFLDNHVLEILLVIFFCNKKWSVLLLFFLFCLQNGQWGFICLARMLGRGRNVCEVLSTCDAQWSNASMNNIFCSIFHGSQLMYQKSVTFGIMLVDRNAQNVYLQEATKKSNW